MNEGFQLGENLIEITFFNTYVTNSAGFHRFQDPEDNQIYLYTHLEPFFCNRWFPCFDQPCFRAVFTLNVTCPKDWQCFSNGALLETTDEGKRIFEPTPPISTYLYGLDAGCYTFVNNDKEFKTPLRVAIRKSKLKFLDASLLFRMLEATMLFYEDFFQTKFPFTKYDTVFCPEFRIRGMENVGMINMTDKYFRPK
jgi:aminopeptidase N